MLTNADITLYNQKINPKTKLTEYIPVQIPNVCWYANQKTEVDRNGVHSANIYKVRIPVESVDDMHYVEQENWNTLEDIIGYWTIQNGDIIVKGLVDDKISAASDLFKKYSQVFRVNSYSDNRMGCLSHFRIGGIS